MPGAHSPVIINTSSPRPSHSPFFSPPSVPQSHDRRAISSSPGLLSPSAFVRPRAAALKTGSRAQQAPDGISVGFKSAASLLKASHWTLEGDGTDVRVAEDPGLAARPFKKSTKGKQDGDAAKGKLVRPRKKRKTEKTRGEEVAVGILTGPSVYFTGRLPAADNGNTAVSATRGQDEPSPAGQRSRKLSSTLSEYSFDGLGRNTRTEKVDKLVPADEPLKARKVSTHTTVSAPAVHSKSPSLALSEYAFKIPDTDDNAPRSPRMANFAEPRKPVGSPAMAPEGKAASDSAATEDIYRDPDDVTAPDQILLAPVAKPTKVRKRAPKKADKTTEGPAKKTRKRKAKSASFILNSDEPEADVALSRPLDLVDASHDSANDIADQPLRSKGFGAFVYDGGQQDSVAGTRPPNAPSMTDAAVTEERSGYFTVADVESEDKPSSPRQTLLPVPQSAARLQHAESPVVIGQVASKRRLSWTPLKDTAVEVSPGTSPLPMGGTSPAQSPPKRQLSTILNSFGYVSDAAAQPATVKEATSNISATKRRRIELGDSATNPPAARKQKQASITEQSAVTKATKEKPPKKAKKVQTITALATAAFQPAEVLPQADALMSKFFPADEGQLSTEQPDSAPTVEPIAPRPKKPRKPRAKAETSNKSDGMPKAKAKSKTVKVKFNEAEHKAQLYSPGKATAQFERQDFVFGTSSQLAVDEDAAFIRDMYSAITASETVQRTSDEAAQQSTQAAASPPNWTSRTRVPTAPHGTNLSVEQADKDHWCHAARDFKGGVVRCHPIRSLSAPKRVQQAVTETNAPVDEPSAGREVTGSDVAGISATLAVAQRQGAATAPGIVLDDEVAVLELQAEPQRQSRDAAEPPDEVPVDTVEAQPTGVELLPSVHPSDQMNVDDEHDENDDDESWMLLRSDDSTTIPLRPHKSTAQPSVIPPATPSKCVAPAATSKPRPSVRSPLKSLDRNLPVLASHESVVDVAITSKALGTTSKARVSKSSPDEKRPRKRITDSADVSLTEQPKRRGRLPKSAFTSPTNVTSVPQHPASSDFLNIDEISDSDTPVTPSPPRRRAKSTPPAAIPLELSPVASPKLKAVAPAIIVPTLKSGDSHWQSVRAELFTRITHTVKTTPHDPGSSKPSWWQKILMYDPIVLEDITAWLNEQNLRVGVKKLKIKPKKRGRKKKDEVEIVAEPEWEVAQEPLQPWMVQKWCEEMSVCCLWKGGLRGGVRVAY